MGIFRAHLAAIGCKGLNALATMLETFLTIFLLTHTHTHTHNSIALPPLHMCVWGNEWKLAFR